MGIELASIQGTQAKPTRRPKQMGNTFQFYLQLISLYIRGIPITLRPVTFEE